MRIRATIVAACFLFTVLSSSPALAQQRHVVTAADMRQAIAAEAVTREQTRDALRGVLKDSKVREVAEHLGLSVTRADGAVASLTGAELDRLAGPVRDVGAQLAGGNTVVIGTTTLLLIIIIVILLVN